MLSALIRKDIGLLRAYLRSAVIATICCYVVSASVAVFMSQYQDEAARRPLPLLLAALQSGSNMGCAFTAFFAAMLAGSVFTLERSDRSAEFLACLPPTRKQNLISKLVVALGAVMVMLLVHLLAYGIAVPLVPYVRRQGVLLLENPLPDLMGLVMFVSIVVAMIGGSLAVSAWVKSNGVPILCGLLTPVLISSLISTLAWALDIPSWGDSFRIRAASSMFVLGIAAGFSGCYWYLNRSEP